MMVLRIERAGRLFIPECRERGAVAWLDRADCVGGGVRGYVFRDCRNPLSPVQSLGWNHGRRACERGCERGHISMRLCPHLHGMFQLR